MMNRLINLLSLATTAAAVWQPTPVPAQNFTQLLDHRGCNDNRTFQQQYIVDTTWFKPGGPILFVQGDESAASINHSQPMHASAFADYASELGAMLVAIEHRFFGLSYPEGMNYSNPADYEPLNLDNVIEDSVTLVKHIKSTVPGAADSKVIVGGGSYGGFLTSILTSKRPDVFYGGIASSPVLNGFSPLGKSPSRFYYHDAMSNIYYDHNSEAAYKLKQALLVFDSCVAKGDCSTIPDLNLCDPKPTAEDLETIYYQLRYQIRLFAQFNSKLPLAYPGEPRVLEVLLNETMKSNSSGAVLRNAFNLGYNLQLNDTNKCVNWTTVKGGGLVINTAGKSYYSVLCSYFTVQTIAVAPGNLIPPVNPTGRVESCVLSPEWQRWPYNETQDWVRHTYGIDDESLDTIERLLIINGLQDPIAALASPRLTLSNNRNHSRVFFVSGMSHGEDDYAEWIYPRGLQDTIDEIRDTKLEYLKEWFGVL